MLPSEFSQIIEAERRRCAAMIALDLIALNDLLDSELYFCHATGQLDDKAAYMEKLGTAAIIYKSIDWSEDQVIPLGADSALLKGRMTSEVSVNGEPKRLDNRALAAWSRRCGQWRIVAFQSTPIKA